MKDQRPCTLCGKTEAAHSLMAHVYQPDVARLEKREDSKPVQSVPERRLPPADPVLRYILIQAGIITVEQLFDAEKKLAATGLLVTGAKFDVSLGEDDRDDRDDRAQEESV